MVTLKPSPGSSSTLSSVPLRMSSASRIAFGMTICPLLDARMVSMTNLQVRRISKTIPRRVQPVNVSRVWRWGVAGLNPGDGRWQLVDCRHGAFRVPVSEELGPDLRLRVPRADGAVRRRRTGRRALTVRSREGIVADPAYRDVDCPYPQPFTH